VSKDDESKNEILFRRPTFFTNTSIKKKDED
jgi:hypothetical protein